MALNSSRRARLLLHIRLTCNTESTPVIPSLDPLDLEFAVAAQRDVGFEECPESRDSTLSHGVSGWSREAKNA